MSHTAERVGPPLVLLALVRWLRRNTALQVGVLLLEGGPLEGAFREVADVHVAAPLPPLDDLLDLPRWPVVDDHAAGWLGGMDPSVVVVNSAASAPGLAYVPGSVPVVTFAHELDLAHHWYEGGGGVLRDRSEHFLAGSGAIARMLQEVEGIPAERITLRYEFIEQAGGTTVPPDQAEQHLRAITGVGPGTPLVGACGVLEWRKGPDLFVHAAAHLHDVAPDLDVHWMWIGGTETFGLGRLLDEADRAGVGDRVHFLGGQPDTGSLIGHLDVFALMSRQDGFPLVCLEAASQGVPFVCFEQGGMPELARRGAGVVVPYGAVDDLATTIGAWVRDRAIRDEVGQAARRLFDEEHHVSVGAPAMLGDLAAWL